MYYLPVHLLWFHKLSLSLSLYLSLSLQHFSVLDVLPNRPASAKPTYSAEKVPFQPRSSSTEPPTQEPLDFLPEDDESSETESEVEEVDMEGKKVFEVGTFVR